MPAREVTSAFDAIVEPWIARLLASCNESRTLAALRDTLLPKLISGELRVKDAERFVPDALKSPAAAISGTRAKPSRAPAGSSGFRKVPADSPSR